MENGKCMKSGWKMAALNSTQLNSTHLTAFCVVHHSRQRH